eukprot:TRINITY_DN63965_c0_g1_i1.p2 TRINITY_DN63965_c0_g1~~TRINITY_DN63965_c0_g1_i1.p2  ORF type:complete len:157 (+),score=25.56 TRINITY_DN63965_c0_g1_i1:36-506(+)
MAYPPATETLPLPRADVDDAQSTTCSSRSEVQDEQADLVVKAMLPIVRRAMISSNSRVFQTSLESLQRIEHLFGKEAIDQNVHSILAAMERECRQRGGRGWQDRATRVFDTLVALCTDEVAAALRLQFPMYDEWRDSSATSSDQRSGNAFDLGAID